jgi:hypothetical protein
MALDFLTDDSGDGRLPFVKEYLELNPKQNGKQFTITEVVKVKSGKGYILNTAKFAVWIWSNSTVTKKLMAVLHGMIEDNARHMPLVVVLDKSTSEHFKLAFDDEKPCTWVKLENREGYSVTPF